MSFKDFSNFGKEERVNVVVSFLAMLELVKEGIIDVTQNDHYGDIEMQTKVFETPNYS
jgi:chromatin segregation and condensation protein Rec8/ScpA/Scc1 (kleisin family)